MGKHGSSSPSPALAARAWRLLRLALKRWHAVGIRRAVSHLKSLCTGRRHHSYRLHYGEHELSFHETPNFRFKKHRGRPLFPCIDPPLVGFDVDEEDDDEDNNFIQPTEELEMDGESCGNDEVEREKGIDLKAEEFISRFYEEMKLQRQVSFLRYNEMLYGGMS